MQVIFTTETLSPEDLSLSESVQIEEIPVTMAESCHGVGEQLALTSSAFVIGRDGAPGGDARFRAFRVRPVQNADASAFIASKAAQAQSADAPINKVWGAGVAYSQRARMEQEIDLAISRNEFELYLQPQIDLRNFQVHGAEVLLRWQHPSRGLLAPAEFLPFAETSGQICSIGRWVLNAVCSNHAKWKEWLEPGATFAVNVSAVEMQDQRFLGNVLAILGAHEVPGSSIELEITETALLANPVSAREGIECFRRNGVRVALDDFGVGYSCLASLRDFPFSKIKIDRSFVQNLGTSNRNRTIVRSMIELGQSLHVAVNAEGVEDGDQLRFLYENGCEEVQGYLLARPMPIHRFVSWVRGYEGHTAVPGFGTQPEAQADTNVIAFHRPSPVPS